MIFLGIFFPGLQSPAPFDRPVTEGSPVFEVIRG